MKGGGKMLVASLGAVLLSAAAAQEEAVLLSQGAGGVLPLESERRLEITGLAGRILVRPGKSGELRFAARVPGERQVEHPVALWSLGRTLRLTAIEGGAAGPLWLEVSLAPELSLVVQASNSEIEFGGVQGGVELRGQGLSILARSVPGALHIDAADSDVDLANLAGGLHLGGRELDARVENISGSVSLQVEGGDVEIVGLDGTLDGELEQALLVVERAQGHVRLEVSGGGLTLGACGGGAELRLEDAPLELRACQGAIAVDTDSEVSFAEHDGPLVVRGSGEGAVRGTKAKGGPLQIETRHAQVLLEEIESETEIRGEGLDVQVKTIRGALSVRTAASSIQVEKAENTVSVENDFGDVQIQETSRLVRVVSRDGEVRLDGLKGPAEVQGDGPAVEVYWVALEGAEISSVENARGDVRVSVPGGLRCQIDAEAPHGQVESEIEELRISEDGHFAAGILNGGQRPAPQVKRPTIRVKSGANLYVEIAGPQAPQG